MDLENDLIQLFNNAKKKLQVLADPVVVNFFEMHLIQHFGNEKKNHLKKNYMYGIKAPIKSDTCIFFLK